MGLFNHNFCVAKQTPCSRLNKYKQTSLLVVLVFIFTIGSARSYVNDHERASAALLDVSHETSLTNYTTSSSNTGLCTSLLNTQIQMSSKTPVIRTQRSVGKVAALGLLLGVRFALEPKQNHSANVTINDAPLMHQVKAVDKTTKKVVAYRRCIKDQALSRIASTR